jgi:hypothetical protein
LRAQAAAGDGFAALGLVELLGERGDLDEAEQILRACADTGNDFAAWALAGRIGPDQSIVTRHSDSGRTVIVNQTSNR